MTDLQFPNVIVVISGDPGGANAITPVVKLLVNQSNVLHVCTYAYREARDIFKENGIAFEEVPDTLSITEAAEIIKKDCATLLLSGTSYNSIELEKRFIAAARLLGVPSLAVLDFWSNYLIRFQDSEGNLAFVPDRIAVMDQLAYKELTALGINSDRLVITGQPAFDVLTTWRKNVSPERRQKNRKLMDISDDEILVLFASQPLAALFGKRGENNPLYQGYDEFNVVKALQNALENIALRRSRKITLLIRPHPRETTNWSAILLSSRIRILVSSKLDRRDQAIASELVTGMNSEMLIETCYIGCPTVSLQPNLRLPDALATNRAGLSRVVYSYGEIQQVIEEMLFNPSIYQSWKSKLSIHELDNGAAERIVSLVHQLLHSFDRRMT